MKKSVISKFVLILLFWPTFLLAQQKEEDYSKQFDKFKNEIQQKFKSFKSANDSIFSAFLRESWEQFELFIDKRPLKPKPETQPRIDSSKLVKLDKLPVILKPIDIDKEIEEYKSRIKPPIVREVRDIQEFVPFKKIDFFGTAINIPLIQTELPALKNVSNSGIASYFDRAADCKELVGLLQNMYKQSEELKLNGWGTLKLIQNVAKELYENRNEQIVFSWFALIKMGYKTKVAYVDNELYLLCNFEVPLYNNEYCEINSEKYYLVLFEGQSNPDKSFYTYRRNHTDQVNRLPLYLKQLPLLKSNLVSKTITYQHKQIKVNINKNLLDFYETYPNCDLAVFLSTPLSETGLKSLDTYFNPLLDGKSDFQKVIILLNFVQDGIKYKMDDQQFGKENYLFAEETLYYPYADCEDRVALLSSLVKHYTGLEYIGLDYPGHLSMAVNIPGAFIGSYLVYKNKQYHFCDPTYIGAGIGMVMPEYQNVKPGVIEIKQ